MIAAADVAAKTTAPGVNWNQVLTSVGIWAGIVGAVAGAVAAVPISRNAVLWMWRALLMRAGVPYHRYARTFIDKYGTYDNPYLRVKEKRDLRSTYVPLSFQSDDFKTVALATDVLTNLPAERLVIIGDPGSGKSTLLRAYGVGALEIRFVLARRTRTVPYLIPMRDLAAFLDRNNDIADFITAKILNESGVFKRDRAAAFFLRTLERRQAVVMLDGLDEVPDDKQAGLLAAVIAFMSDMRQECPTGQAKIMLTCRTQNFEMLRENWMSALGAHEALYALAPLRDSEITSYLLKFKSLFKSVDGPAKFMRSVREAKTLDLLRAPLILAIAVGLYADRPTLIPATVSELYRRMIEELLDRHTFKHERRPDESLLTYSRNDKYRFLREFALDAARKSGSFSDFTRADLERFGAALAPRLDDVRNGRAMVFEIIKHSGLLGDAGHDGLLHYAHRSIQEFLAAEELRLRGDADGILLGQANDLNWRQVIQFYTAGEEARLVDDFLGQLAKRNNELAAYCLQAARPSDGTALAVLDALEPVTDTRLAALAAATRSPRTPVRAMAVKRLSDAITSGSVLSTVNANTDSLLPLLETIASTNAADIAALVPHIISNLPDNPRLVGPLWRCLSADAIEQRQVCAEIVQRLLTMVMEPNAFAELARQDPNDRDFLTSLRSRAYPFKNALPPEHNLVTLLAWADYLSVIPPAPNRFFAAKSAGKLGNVEGDRRRTIAFSPFTPARIYSTAAPIAAAIAALPVILITPENQFLHPYGWKTLLLYFAAGESPLWIYLASFFLLSKFWPALEPASPSLGDEVTEDGNAFLAHDLGPRWVRPVVAFVVIPLIFSMAPVPLASRSLSLYLICVISFQVLFWATNMKMCIKGSRHFIYRPNKYVDMYDNPDSRHWVAKYQKA